MKKLCTVLCIFAVVIFSRTYCIADDFNLDGDRNTAMIRFEIDNDTVWDEDSQFTNGWSLQFHSIMYPGWDETEAPYFIKWIGNNFPTLHDDESIVRYGHGIGQNMMTPGDLRAEIPKSGDMPYAGTITYTFNWQNFNRHKASNLQITAGMLGEASLAEQFQKIVHNDLGMGDTPRGWDTQRDSEPILNVGYQHFWRLAHAGDYTNDWAGQITAGTNIHAGNLFTAGEVGLAFRYGWNIQEGFNTYPAPPGRGFFQACRVPKPAAASPHGFEVVLGGMATGLMYSVLYDGSMLTDDDRDVERRNYFFSGLIGFNYHYYDLLSLRLSLVKATDVLEEDDLPDPPAGREKTTAHNSYGALVIEIHF
jgi:hypothetical protein